MRVLMIEGRPAEHPIHRDYALSVGADFIFIDQFLRYQGKKSGRVRTLCSWIITAIYLLCSPKYNVFLCGGPCPPLIFLRRFRLLPRRRRVFSLAANETLFFLVERKYSDYTQQLYQEWYNNTIDGLFCIGSFQEDLARRVVYNTQVPIVRMFNGLPDAFFEKASIFKYDPQAHDIVCIANGPSGFRIYYKGIDLVIAAFVGCCSEGFYGRLLVIGDWDKETQDELLQSVPQHLVERIVFTGKLTSFLPYLQHCVLSVHFSRGDSFPTSNLETLALGIPTLVTDLTGTAEVVRHISSEWVLTPDLEALTKGMMRFLRLSIDEKIRFSQIARSVLKEYRHSAAIDNFRKLFDNLINY